MKWCLIPGGFKPFHVGHYARYLYALNVYSDHSVKLVTMTGTRQNFKHASAAVQRRLLAKHSIHIEYCNKSPISWVYDFIDARKYGTDEIVILGGDDVISLFTLQLGTPKEVKHFGLMHKDGRLRFATPNDSDIIDLPQCKNFRDKIHIRGSDVRKLVQDGNYYFAKEYLPPFYSDEEARELITSMRP